MPGAQSELLYAYDSRSFHIYFYLFTRDAPELRHAMCKERCAMPRVQICAERDGAARTCDADYALLIMQRKMRRARSGDESPRYFERRDAAPRCASCKERAARAVSLLFSFIFSAGIIALPC